MTPHYLEVAPDSVRLWCDRRLPFEPKGEIKAIRDDLRHAIRALSVRGTGVLAAHFSSEDRTACDVENTLFYNVGPWVFGTLATQGLTFSRRRQTPPAAPNGQHFAHLHEYTARTRLLSGPEGSNGRTLSFTCPRLTAVPTATAIWWYATAGSGWSGSPIRGRFSVHIDLQIGTERLNLVQLVKPLIDGLVASMHRDDAPDAEATARIARVVECLPAEVVRRLQTVPNPLLPARTLVRPFRETTKWDPADDACDAGTIIVTRSSATATTLSVTVTDL